MRLREHTLQLLVNRPKPLTYARIEADTGISKHWLVSFVVNRLDNVCVDKVQTLYEYLTGDTVRLNF